MNNVEHAEQLILDTAKDAAESPGSYRAQLHNTLRFLLYEYPLAVHVDICVPCARRRVVKGKAVYCAKAKALAGVKP